MINRRDLLKSLPFLSVPGLLFGREQKATSLYDVLENGMDIPLGGEVGSPESVTARVCQGKPYHNYPWDCVPFEYPEHVCMSHSLDITRWCRNQYGLIICRDLDRAEEVRESLNLGQDRLSRYGDFGLDCRETGSSLWCTAPVAVYWQPERNLDWFCILDKERTDPDGEIQKYLIERLKQSVPRGTNNPES